MKKLTYILLIFITACGQNSDEKELNGTWREIENEYSTWHFYPDSLVFKIADFVDRKTVWDANDSQIRFEIPTFYTNSQGKLRDTTNKVIINYKLSEKKDSLYGTLKNNYGIHNFTMLKTNSYYQYLSRKFNVQFSLPKIDSAELIKVDPVYGLKIFMAVENNKIVSKTELSNSLNNLESDVKSFKKKLENYFGVKDWRVEKFHFSVYADKSIPDSIITSSLLFTTKSDFYINNDLPRPPIDTIPIKIYRMDKNEGDDSLSFRKAKKIKSFAKTIYLK